MRTSHVKVLWVNGSTDCSPKEMPKSKILHHVTVAATQDMGRCTRKTSREKPWNIISDEKGMTGDVYEEYRVSY